MILPSQQWPVTQAGFVTWVRNVMGVSTDVLPDNSPYIPMALAVSLELVNRDILRASPLIYQLCVYNLGGDNLVNYAQDAPGAPLVLGSEFPYWQTLRNKFNVYGFVSGVVSSSSDNGTSVSLVVQEAAQTFTLSDLQNLKTPWGRQYLAFAQQYGTQWGLT